MYFCSALRRFPYHFSFFAFCCVKTTNFNVLLGFYITDQHKISHNCEVKGKGFMAVHIKI